MKNILIAFAALAVLKIVLNFVRYLQCRFYLSKFFEFLRDSKWDLVEHRSQVIKLFKGAGVKDAYLPLVEAAGYGMVRSGHVSVFANFPNSREDFAETIVGKFHNAIGVYRSRMLETLNPLYWLEFFLNLPKHALMYLGLSAENVIIKLFQLLYWCVCLAFTIALSLYGPDIRKIVDNYIAKSAAESIPTAVDSTVSKPESGE